MMKASKGSSQEDKKIYIYFCFTELTMWNFIYWWERLLHTDNTLLLQSATYLTPVSLVKHNVTQNIVIKMLCIFKKQQKKDI